MPASLHFVVTGAVQGVGFRAFCISQAKRAGLVGWCKNTKDGGSVEGVAQGDRDAVQSFKAALQKGPGTVESVKGDTKDVDKVEYSRFEQK